MARALVQIAQLDGIRRSCARQLPPQSRSNRTKLLPITGRAEFLRPVIPEMKGFCSPRMQPRKKTHKCDYKSYL